MKVLFKLLGVALLLATSFSILNSIRPTWVSSDVYLLIIILFFMTGLTAIANIWAYRNNYLVIVFTASQVLRMLICIVILYFLIRAAPLEANTLVVNFFIIYLILLIFEISTLLINLRAEFRKPE